MTKESLKADIFHILYSHKELENKKNFQYAPMEEIIAWIEFEKPRKIDFIQGDILRYKDRKGLYLVYDVETTFKFGEYGWDPNDYVIVVIPVEIVRDRLRSTVDYYAIRATDVENFHKVTLETNDDN